MVLVGQVQVPERGARIEALGAQGANQDPHREVAAGHEEVLRVPPDLEVGREPRGHGDHDEAQDHGGPACEVLHRHGEGRGTGDPALEPLQGGVVLGALLRLGLVCLRGKGALVVARVDLGVGHPGLLVARGAVAAAAPRLLLPGLALVAVALPGARLGEGAVLDHSSRAKSKEGGKNCRQRPKKRMTCHCAVLCCFKHLPKHDMTWRDLSSEAPALADRPVAEDRVPGGAASPREALDLVAALHGGAVRHEEGGVARGEVPHQAARHAEDVRRGQDGVGNGRQDLLVWQAHGGIVGVQVLRPRAVEDLVVKQLAVHHGLAICPGSVGAAWVLGSPAAIF